MESNDHKFLYLCVCKFCKRKLRGNVCLDTRTVISTAHASGTSAQEIWDLCHSTSWPTSSNSRSCSCVYTTKNRIQVTMLLSRLPRNRQFIKVEYFFSFFVGFSPLPSFLRLIFSVNNFSKFLLEFN